MLVTRNELQALIDKSFRGADTSGLQEESHRIYGFIRSEEFGGLDDDQRRDLLRTKIREVLGLRGINVGWLIALAPGEDPWN